MTEGIAFTEQALHDNLSVRFQPIVELDPQPRMVAIECLTRGPEGTELHSADALFTWVRRRRLEQLVDRMCVVNALQQAEGIAEDLDICVNVHVKTLSSSSFRSFLLELAEMFGIPLRRVILEVVEHSDSWSSPTLLGCLDRLREEGCRIAIDDFGVGRSNFQHLLEWQPDYLKIGRYFIAGWEEDPRRLDVLESVSALAHRFQVPLIAEGVETHRELALVSSLGINLVQGFLFSPPMMPASLGQFRLDVM